MPRPPMDVTFTLSGVDLEEEWAAQTPIFRERAQGASRCCLEFTDALLMTYREFGVGHTCVGQVQKILIFRRDPKSGQGGSLACKGSS